MEHITPSPSKTSLPLGLLFGFVSILMFVVMYMMDIDVMTNSAAKWTSSLLTYLILPVLFIYIGCNTYKKHNDGYISFGKCLAIGVGICAIAGLVYGAFTVIFNMIFPEYMEEIFAKSTDAMIEQNPNMTEEQLEMTKSWMTKMNVWYFIIPISVIYMTVVGLIYSLIIGAIVRKDRPAF